MLSQQPGKFPDPGSASFPWRGTVERFFQSYELVVAARLSRSAVAGCVELLQLRSIRMELLAELDRT